MQGVRSRRPSVNRQWASHSGGVDGVDGEHLPVARAKVCRRGGWVARARLGPVSEGRRPGRKRGDPRGGCCGTASSTRPAASRVSSLTSSRRSACGCQHADRRSLMCPAGLSGSNLVIVAGTVLGLLRLLRADPRVAAVLSAAALLGFVVLARPSPSVLRAAVWAVSCCWPSRSVAHGRPCRRSPRPCSGCCSWIRRWRPTPGSACRCWPRRRWCWSYRGGWPGCGGAACLPAQPRRWRCRGGLPRDGTADRRAERRHQPGGGGREPARGSRSGPGDGAGRGGRGAVPGVGDRREGRAWLAGPAVGWLVAVADRAAAVPGGVVPWPDGVTGAGLLAVVVLALVALARSRRSGCCSSRRWSACCWFSCPPGRCAPGWPPPGWAVVACDVGQGDVLVLATGSRGGPC